MIKENDKVTQNQLSFFAGLSLSLIKIMLRKLIY